MTFEIDITLVGDKDLADYYNTASQRVRQGFRGGLQRAARILKRKIDSEAPQFSGNLVRTNVAKKVGDLEWEVGPTADYADAVNAGRRPGSAAPPLSSGRFQAWLAGHGIPRRNWWAVARAIGRNGIEANPFLDRSFDAVEGDMIDEIVRSVDQAING